MVFMKMKTYQNYYVEVAMRFSASSKPRKFGNYTTIEATSSLKKCCKIIKDFINSAKEQGDSTCYILRIIKRIETHTVIEKTPPIYPCGKKHENSHP